MNLMVAMVLVVVWAYIHVKLETNICRPITGAICRPPQRINQKLPVCIQIRNGGRWGLGVAPNSPLSNKCGGEHVPQHHHGPDADVQGSRKGVHNVHIVDCNHSGMSKLCTLASSFQA